WRTSRNTQQRIDFAGKGVISSESDSKGNSKGIWDCLCISKWQIRSGDETMHLGTMLRRPKGSFTVACSKRYTITLWFNDCLCLLVFDACLEETNAIKRNLKL